MDSNLISVPQYPSRFSRAAITILVVATVLSSRHRTLQKTGRNDTERFHTIPENVIHAAATLSQRTSSSFPYAPPLLPPSPPPNEKARSSTHNRHNSLVQASMYTMFNGRAAVRVRNRSGFEREYTSFPFPSP